MNKPIRTTMIALGLAVSAALGGAVANTAMNSVSFARAEREVSAARTSLAETADLSNAFKLVSKAVEPSVVQIRTKTMVTNPMSGLRRMLPFGPDSDSPSPDSEDGMFSMGSGSGVVMQTEGNTAYILTNNHVVANANSLEVVLNDGRVITEAKVLGTDPRTDLAVVRINASNLIPAKWGDSSTLEKGDWVIAFGSPFGYVGSMTHGIVSALNRQIGVLGRNGFEEFIQTDAAINPGNSGGPLVNIRGEVIGINTLIASRSGGFQGLGFAVPTKIAQPVFEQIKSEGRVTRGWLGVAIADVATEEAEIKDLVSATGYQGTTGVFVSETVRNGPAFAHLQPGDIITAINSKPVNNTRQLREMVAGTTPGTHMTFTVFRRGKTESIKITLGEQPDDLQMANNSSAPAQRETPRQEQVSGLTLRDLNSNLAKQNGLDGVTGALITNLQPTSAAYRAGLRPGDVITRINGKEVTSANQASELLKSADLAKGVSLNVANKEGTRFVLIRER